MANLNIRSPERSDMHYRGDRSARAATVLLVLALAFAPAVALLAGVTAPAVATPGNGDPTARGPAGIEGSAIDGSNATTGRAHATAGRASTGAGARAAVQTRDAAVFVVDDLEAPERIRPGERFTVTARVTNEGRARGTEAVAYSFDAITVQRQSVTLAAGASTRVEFRTTVSEIEDRHGPVDFGTHIHGVRNETSEGDARSIRVTPDVDFEVSGFDAPTEITRGEPFVVAATVTNPGSTSISREVRYEFDTHTVVTRELTVAGGASEEVAVRVTIDEVEDSAGIVRVGETYDHLITTTGGSQAGGAVRAVRGATSDPSALGVTSFRAPTDLRPGDDVRVEVAVRNVETVAFEGTISYRFEGIVVATERVRVPAGERRSLAFTTSYGAIDSAAGPLRSDDTTHGVWIAGASTRTATVAVHASTATPTPTPTATPTPDTGSNDGGSDDGGSGDGGSADGGSGTDTEPGDGGTATPTPSSGDGDDCRRGFFTACGGLPGIDETTLTVIGIVTSVFGIVYEMISN
jgi:hypothetical protein